MHHKFFFNKIIKYHIDHIDSYTVDLKTLQDHRHYIDIKLCKVPKQMIKGNFDIDKCLTKTLIIPTFMKENLFQFELFIQ